MEHIFLCDLAHVGQQMSMECFPYGIGCISAYLEKHFPCPITAHLFKFSKEIYDRLIEYRPKIVGFGNYTWNLHLSKTMAGLIKQEFPGTIIIFGGPNFPKNSDEQEQFLKATPVIDFYIEGEGEYAFLELVRNLYEFDFDVEAVKRKQSPNMRTIDSDGNLLAYQMVPRFMRLDAIPSPYLTRKLDKFFGQKLMPMIQTVRGCPFTCTYCVEGRNYYQRIAKRKNLQVTTDEVEYIAKRVKGNSQLFIADSNYGMYPEDEESSDMIGRIMDKYDFPKFVQVAMGKNNKARVLKVARNLRGRVRISGSVQSLDTGVLKSIERNNISSKQLLEFAEEAYKTGANSYSEIILGLPMDSSKTFMKTYKQVLEAGFNYTTVYTLILLMGSVLGSRENIQRYGYIVKYRIIPRCFGIYKFGNKEFLSGEVEKVCVDSNTMSFGDYLECRQFALTVGLFYNHRIFEEILGTLKVVGISPFEWLKSIHGFKDQFPEILKETYQNFAKDTTEELWESEEELIEFLLTPEGMQKFIFGELGQNIFFKYVNEALAGMVKEVNEIAFDIAFQLMAKKRADIYKQDKEYFEQLKKYSLLRREKLFDFEHEPDGIFDYNFEWIREQKAWGLRSRGRTGKQYFHCFSHNPDQVGLIKEQIGVFGNNSVGMSRAIARVPIFRIYRTARVEEAASV